MKLPSAAVTVHVTVFEVAAASAAVISAADRSAVMPMARTVEIVVCAAVNAALVVAFNVPVPSVRRVMVAAAPARAAAERPSWCEVPFTRITFVAVSP